MRTGSWRAVGVSIASIGVALIFLGCFLSCYISKITIPFGVHTFMMKSRTILHT